METPKNIQEKTITVGDVRINISQAGLWMDNLDSAGNVQSSTALAWEELSAAEHELYSALVECEPVWVPKDIWTIREISDVPVTAGEICDLPALRKVG